MITTLEDVEAWLGSGHDPAIVSDAWLAAEAYVGKRVRWPESEPAPDDLVQAVRLQSARYLARRSSPDGLVGMSDIGPARVPTTDRDVLLLISPWMPVVVA